jgi:hypothetical protein
MGGGRGAQRGHRGSRDGALLAAALGDRARGQRQRHPARHPGQIWATTTSGHQAPGGSSTVTRGDPHAWYPASVPFPAGSLTGFGITIDGKVLVAIPLRPGTPPNEAGAPVSRA